MLSGCLCVPALDRVCVPKFVNTVSYKVPNGITPILQLWCTWDGTVMNFLDSGMKRQNFNIAARANMVNNLL